MNGPICGKVAKLSIERALGTVIGGWLGYATFQTLPLNLGYHAAISIVFSYVAALVAAKLKLEYSGKLAALTFLLGVLPLQPCGLLGLPV